jgi:hypothetical protein
VLLLLPVWHCPQSIALWAGSPVALALPMAVAIDCGLIACEVALISEPRRWFRFPPCFRGPALTSTLHFEGQHERDGHDC